MNLLYVEDSETLLDIVPQLLKARGHQVSCASNGKEALEVLKQLKPDVILADIMMPGMDGFALLRELQVTPELSSVPVVVMTGRPMDDSTIELIRREPNVAKLLQKPVSEDKILETLNEIAAKLGMAPKTKEEHYISDPKDFHSFFPQLDLGIEEVEKRAKERKDEQEKKKP